jgi:hypothetical protein
MLRGREKRVARALLHQFAGIHHADAVGIFRHHAEVVGDQQHAHLPLGLEPAQHVEHLRLDGHVERRGRLVGDQELGLARQRHRDHHPLAQPAGQFERIAVEPARRIRHAHGIEQPARGVARGLPGEPAVQRQCLADLLAHLDDRIQRQHRLLENHRHLPAAHAPHVAFGQRQHVGFAELHAARRRPARRPAAAASATAR